MTETATEATGRLRLIGRRNPDGSIAMEIAHLLTLDGSDYTNLSECLVRRTGGRWRVTTWRDARAGDLSAIVEVTALEQAQIAAGGMNRAVYARLTKTIEWMRSHSTETMATTMDPLPTCAKVSSRGRARSIKSVPAVGKGTLPAPIMRPNGAPYYPRTLFGRLDIDHILAVHNAMRSNLLYGPPGTGKTALLEAAFANTGFEYVPGTSDTEAGDFIGSFVPEPGGTYRWVDGPLLRAMEKGVPLIIDEIALIDPRALSIVYAATDGRRECYVTSNAARGTVKAKDGFGLHGACNPDAPGADMSEALLSRMFSQIEYGTDYDLMSHFVAPNIVTFAKNLEKRRLEGEVTWSPQTRELMAFADMERLFDTTTALANLVSSAPALDRITVTDVLQRAIGVVIEPLRIGGYRHEAS